MEKPLVNRVAASGLITIKLEDWYPEGEIVVFDLADFLFQGLVLREKEFRQALKAHDWEQYRDKHVLLQCRTDAIIPTWAWMLLTSYLEPVARSVFHGSREEFLKNWFIEALRREDPSKWAGQRIVLKGCGDKHVPEAAYVELTRILRPIAQSIMYGEPCSTVPIYKKPRQS